jgi:HlyD family secretion protein
MKKLAQRAFFKGPRGLLTMAAAVLAIAGAALAFRTATPPRVPTAEVMRGEFVDDISIRGEIKALHSIQITAPSMAGDLQIVRLVPTGTTVRKGEVVVQFDTTALQVKLDQKRSELKSAEADIDRSRAEARMTREQQATDLLQGRYDVDKAKLDASKNEILSEIEGAETRLKVADAEQKYQELQQKDASTKESTDAEIQSRIEKRRKSAFDVQMAEKQIASLTLRAPADGMVTILPNYRARNWSQGGSTPDFKEGDRAWSGAVIAELPDLSTVRMRARVDEDDRGRLTVNQRATVRIDALADKEFPATVAEISPIAKPDYSSWPFTKNFDIALQIQDADARIRPGLSAGARIAVVRIPGSILVPAEAVFEKNGHSLVYVLRRSHFEERTVEVARRSKTQILIAAGLGSGERVATRDPTQESPGR